MRVDDSGTIYFGVNYGSYVVHRTGDAALHEPDCYARYLAAQPYSQNRGYESRAKWCTNQAECRRRWAEEGVDTHASLPDGVEPSEVSIASLPRTPEGQAQAKAAKVIFPPTQE